MKKGISLIVLVVTIIVMIIIAGAIIISLSNTNVIDQAEYATERYKVAVLEEKINLVRQEKLLAEYGTIENVNISVSAVLDITTENVEEYVVNIATANSIPANMPAGKYYKLDENKYATKTRENEREMLLASRGIDRDNKLITNTYVVNENFDVYYVISGTIGEPETETVDWKYAWTSDGTTWSDIIKAEELADGTKVEGKIVAKIYETDEDIEEIYLEDEELTLPAGKGYILEIEGEGEAPAVVKMDDEEAGGYLAWWEALLNYYMGEVVDPIIPYVTKVVIGEGITNVPDYITGGNGINLKEVSLSSTVKEIGESAFNSCKKLNNIVLPEGLEIIGQDAFNRSAISSIIIPNSIKTIDRYAFDGCKNLETVVIGKGITKIELMAFGYCSKLEKIYIEKTEGNLEINGAFPFIANTATIYVRNDEMANLIRGMGFSSTTISNDYNWVAPTN